MLKVVPSALYLLVRSLKPSVLEKTGNENGSIITNKVTIRRKFGCITALRMPPGEMLRQFSRK
jgi:hypothetical protein